MRRQQATCQPCERAAIGVEALVDHLRPCQAQYSLLEACAGGSRAMAEGDSNDIGNSAPRSGSALTPTRRCALLWTRTRYRLTLLLALLPCVRPLRRRPPRCRPLRVAAPLRSTRAMTASGAYAASSTHRFKLADAEALSQARRARATPGRAERTEPGGHRTRGQGRDGWARAVTGRECCLARLVRGMSALQDVL